MVQLHPRQQLCQSLPLGVNEILQSEDNLTLSGQLFALMVNAIVHALVPLAKKPIKMANAQCVTLTGVKPNSIVSSTQAAKTASFIPITHY